MAKKKKPIVEKVTVRKTLDLTGTLNLDNLQGLIIEMEDMGEKDVCSILKRYNGRFGTLSFIINETEELETTE